MSGSRSRLSALPRPGGRPVDWLPSLLAVEVGIAFVPYVTVAGLVVFQGAILGAGREFVSGPALVLGLLGVVAVVALPLLLLAHAAVDLGRFALDRSGPWPARRVGHVAVRLFETVAAVLYLDFLREGWIALTSPIPSPAGVGIMLGFAGGFLILSGLVFTHGTGRLVLGVADRRKATDRPTGDRREA